MLTCLNQQVLTEVGGGGKYKEPAFPNRNLLKVASDLEGACQSEKSKAAWVCMDAFLSGAPPASSQAWSDTCLQDWLRSQHGHLFWKLHDVLAIRSSPCRQAQTSVSEQLCP